MKNSSKIIAVAIVLLAVIAGSDAKAAVSSANVPANVIKEFNSKYPDAKIKKWKIENGDYVVEFKADGKTSTSIYNEEGNWEKTITSVKYVKQLPAAVSAGFNNSTFHNFCVEDIKTIATPNGIQYKLRVDNYNCNTGITEGIGDEENDELKFNADGQVIKILDLDGPDEDDI